MSRSVLVVLAFIGVFAAGVVSGGLVGVRIAQRWTRQEAVDQQTQQQLVRLINQLPSLTEEQKTRAHAILNTAFTEVQQHRRENVQIARDADEKIRALLTPEQRDQFDRIRNRMRENEKRLQRWIREQRERRQEMWNKGTPPALP